MHIGLEIKLRPSQVLVEECEDAAVGVFGRRVVVAESGDPGQRLARSLFAKLWPVSG